MGTKEKQKNVILKVKEIFEGLNIPTVLSEATKDDENDVLSVAIEGYGLNAETVVGEFSFIPWARAASGVSYFSAIMELCESLPRKNISDLYKAVNRINYALPYGKFSVSPDESKLLFSAEEVLLDSDSEDAIFSTVNTVISHAMDIPEPYMDILIKLSAGRVKLFEIYDLFPYND